MFLYPDFFHVIVYYCIYERLCTWLVRCFVPASRRSEAVPRKLVCIPFMNSFACPSTKLCMLALRCPWKSIGSVLKIAANRLDFYNG
jgi:hypothetical protein